MARLHELKKQRAELKAKMAAIATKTEELDDGADVPPDLTDEFTALKDQVSKLDERITLIEDALSAAAGEAEPVDGEAGDNEGKAHGHGVRKGVPAQAGAKIEKGLTVAGAAKMLALGGSLYGARLAAKDVYGENHPVTKVLQVGSGPSGGFIVPPEQALEIIEVLRPMTVVRDSNPRTLAMPRGTMTLPRQNQVATATYGAEVGAIPTSEQKLDAIVATYKKLTALVPVSNDLMRYADPSADAMVRDDLALVIARTEDRAFLRGDGTAGSPKGFRSFVVAANVVASADAYTYLTVNSELAGALRRLKSSNVPRVNPVWIMTPRTEMYLYSLQNTQGLYIYRDEMDQGKLFGVPYKTTTQIPENLSNGTHNDCSEIYLVEMSQALLLDSMTLELSVSREATYVDGSGNTVNTFQSDQTLIRAIAEHDFQMRHDEAIAVINGVRWSPS